MIEKRRWPRVVCEWEAAFSPISDRPLSGVSPSTTVDLSRGGVRFRTATFVPVGGRLRFTLRPPKHAALEAVLLPVWVREIPNLSLFEVGGSFEEMSGDALSALKEWTDSRQAVLVTRVPEAIF